MLCRDGKSVLDRINQTNCVGLRLLQTMETEATVPGQRWGGTGRSEASVITLQPLIIHGDRRLHVAHSANVHAERAEMCWRRCEHLDLLICELCNLLTLS